MEQQREAAAKPKGKSAGGTATKQPGENEKTDDEEKAKLRGTYTHVWRLVYDLI